MSSIIRINEYTAAELDVYARCSEPVLRHIYEPELGLFIAESENVIRRALAAGYEAESLLIEDKMLEDSKELIELCSDIPVYTASMEVLAGITGFKLTRGMLCAMKRREYPSVASICDGARRIAILEGVVNPTNIGAIFRSAAALNMDGILLTPDCADPLYRRAARVSMGTVFQIPYTYICDSREQWETEGMQLIKSMGYTTVAMALKEDSIPISDNRIKQHDKLAVILGTEGEGLTDNTIEKSDYKVIIPMAHGVDSLNVAAASAVAFWELTRRQSHM